jgi:hypothetical protein
MKSFLLRAIVSFLALSFALQSIATQTTTPTEHVRGPEQTLLTFPEWFLVFSPYEYGEFIAKQRPSQFPFYTHIGQFWESYKAVTQETMQRNLDSNPGYHLMIMVIGVSTTVEYGIKSAYESLIGRLTEGLSGHQTQEDQYAAAVAQDYVRFIRDLPWYEYNFAAKLGGLWVNTDVWGDHLLRKWERKFALTTEYGIKMLYSKLIKLGTKSIYDAPLMTTAVRLDAAPKSDAKWPEIKPLNAITTNGAFVTIPRYEGFTAYAQALAIQGLNFTEIAGNQSFILVSVLTDKAWQGVPNSSTLFTQTISTSPNTRRIALLIPVKQLAENLRKWSTSQVKVEHIFDY